MVNDLEWPRLNILLNGRIVEAATDQTPSFYVNTYPPSKSGGWTDLISKMVFLGFIAAWFFADSPIRRSLSVKLTNEGVVNDPEDLLVLVLRRAKAPFCRLL